MRLLDRIPALDAPVHRIASWLAVFGVMGTVLSWLASQVPSFADYGWATFIFIGLGAACVLSLVFSVALIALRYFRPLTTSVVVGPPETNSEVSALTTTMTNLFKDSDARISRLETNVEKQVRAQTEINRTLDGGIGRVEDKAEKAMKVMDARVVTLQTLLEQHKSHVALEHQAIGQGQMRLRDAILARDDDATIKVQDKIIVELGSRLLAADDKIYLSADSPTKAWAADYEMWEQAVAELDSIIGRWQPRYKRHLDLSRHDYERTPELPPATINSDPKIITRFKTVCIVQGRYMQAKSGVAEYFSAKIRDSLA